MGGKGGGFRARGSKTKTHICLSHSNFKTNTSNFQTIKGYPQLINTLYNKKYKENKHDHHHHVHAHLYWYYYACMHACICPYTFPHVSMDHDWQTTVFVHSTLIFKYIKKIELNWPKKKYTLKLNWQFKNLFDD
jgi:hypothetical protein